MQKKEAVLKAINKAEDRLAVAKILDKADVAARSHRLVHTDFLDRHLADLAEKVLPSLKTCEYTFFGGFSGAERSVVLFRPEYASDDEMETFQEGILRIVEITPLARESLSHRDYLGALMSLGIKREVLGDIIVTDEKCSVVVLSEMADYIAGNLFKVGNMGVRLKVSDIMELSVPEPKSSEIKTAVAALRLDSICAPAFGLSRSKAAELIKAGKVQLNWEIEINPDKAVLQGDTISLRGKGRAIIETIGGKTRKDRTTIFIKKLI